jgi:Ca2+/H+ antiporter
MESTIFILWLIAAPFAAILFYTPMVIVLRKLKMIALAVTLFIAALKHKDETRGILIGISKSLFLIVFKGEKE